MLDVIYKETKYLRGNKNGNSSVSSKNSRSVPETELFSNQFLEDLEKIWKLRHIIPDPKDPSTWK